MKSALVLIAMMVFSVTSFAGRDANLLKRAFKLSDTERKDTIEVYETNDAAVHPEVRQKENLDNAVNLEIGDEMGTARSNVTRKTFRPVKTTQSEKLNKASTN